MTDIELMFIYERALNLYIKLKNSFNLLDVESIKNIKDYFAMAHIKREIICFEEDDVYCYIHIENNDFYLEHSIMVGVASTYYSFEIDELIDEIHMLKMDMSS